MPATVAEWAMTVAPWLFIAGLTVHVRRRPPLVATND